jgi:hypothetical protein
MRSVWILLVAVVLVCVGSAVQAQCCGGWGGYTSYYAPAYSSGGCCGGGYGSYYPYSTYYGSYYSPYSYGYSSPYYYSAGYWPSTYYTAAYGGWGGGCCGRW